jgi:hypothetical protein
VKPSFFRALLLLGGLAFGASACLTSDAPNLATEDLTVPADFVGTYFATAFPEKVDEGTIDATLEAIGDRTFRLSLSEGEHKDAPVVVRLLTLNDGTLLGVFTDPDPSKGAMYAKISHVSNGGWVFRGVNFDPAKRNRALREALMRHGTRAVAFDSSDLQHDEIQGSLTAANLRALFSDPDFSRALEDAPGFRLSPKTSRTSGIALQ